MAAAFAPASASASATINATRFGWICDTVPPRNQSPANTPSNKEQLWALDSSHDFYMTGKPLNKNVLDRRPIFINEDVYFRDQYRSAEEKGMQLEVPHTGNVNRCRYNIIQDNPETNRAIFQHFIYTTLGNGSNSTIYWGLDPLQPLQQNQTPIYILSDAGFQWLSSLYKKCYGENVVHMKASNLIYVYTLATVCDSARVRQHIVFERPAMMFYGKPTHDNQNPNPALIVRGTPENPEPRTIVYSSPQDTNDNRLHLFPEKTVYGVININNNVNNQNTQIYKGLFGPEASILATFIKALPHHPTKDHRVPFDYKPKANATIKSFETYNEPLNITEYLGIKRSGDSLQVLYFKHFKSIYPNSIMTTIDRLCAVIGKFIYNVPVNLLSGSYNDPSYYHFDPQTNQNLLLGGGKKLVKDGRKKLVKGGVNNEGFMTYYNAIMYLCHISIPNTPNIPDLPEILYTYMEEYKTHLEDCIKHIIRYGEDIPVAFDANRQAIISANIDDILRNRINGQPIPDHYYMYDYIEYHGYYTQFYEDVNSLRAGKDAMQKIKYNDFFYEMNEKILSILTCCINSYIEALDANNTYGIYLNEIFRFFLPNLQPQGVQPQQLHQGGVTKMEEKLRKRAESLLPSHNIGNKGRSRRRNTTLNTRKDKKQNIQNDMRQGTYQQSRQSFINNILPIEYINLIGQLINTHMADFRDVLEEIIDSIENDYTYTLMQVAFPKKMKLDIAFWKTDFDKNLEYIIRLIIIHNMYYEKYRYLSRIEYYIQAAQAAAQGAAAAQGGNYKYSKFKKIDTQKRKYKKGITRRNAPLRSPQTRTAPRRF